jgi:uncharacterized protein YndB with AHSA1/START domain
MGTITHSIEINAPLQAVYNQWTRFEEFPRFMGGIDEVRQDGPNKLFWRAKIGGKEKEWEAKITEQVSNERIAWQSVGGAPNRGAVTFEEVDISLTRVNLKMEYDPEGLLEQAGDALGIPLGQVEEDLNRFRDLMEKKEASPILGAVSFGRLETSGSTEQNVKEECDAFSVKNSTDRTLPFENRESPEIIVPEAIAPSNEGFASDPVTPPRGHESFQEGTPGIEVPSGLETLTDEGTSFAEHLENDDQRAEAGAPRRDQIAHRAYELYLERGEKPGSEHEDWLAAEKELSEKSRDNRLA